MSQFITGTRGKYRIVIAAILFGLVAACGGGDKDKTSEDVGVAGEVVQRAPKDQVAARQREQRRQKARDAQEQEFSYFRYRIDMSGEQPLACLVFSAALDPKTDYSPSR